MNTSESEENLVFDHLTLRRTVGAIALSFSFVVAILATTITASISASYHTDARDVFVGFLFIIGILLVAYKGHTPDIPLSDVGIVWHWVGGFLNRVSKTWNQIVKYWKVEIEDFRTWGRKYEEDFISTIGGLAAIAAAVFPTTCDRCNRDLKSDIHIAAAAILFSIVVYFCLAAFLRRAISKLEPGQNGRFTFLRIVKYALMGDGRKADKRKILRLRIYLVSGLGIAVIMLGLVAVQFTVLEETRIAFHITYWAETAALCLFGVSWMTASQLWFLLDDDEKVQLKRSKGVRPAID